MGIPRTKYPLAPNSLAPKPLALETLRTPDCAGGRHLGLLLEPLWPGWEPEHLWPVWGCDLDRREALLRTGGRPLGFSLEPLWPRWEPEHLWPGWEPDRPCRPTILQTTKTSRALARCVHWFEQLVACALRSNGHGHMVMLMCCDHDNYERSQRAGTRCAVITGIIN